MLDIMYPATATALVGAGLITVMVFPALAFALIGERDRARRVKRLSSRSDSDQTDLGAPAQPRG